MDTKQRTTKRKTVTESHYGSNNQQRVNNNRTATFKRTAVKATQDLNAFYWYQILALDSAVVEAQNKLARMEDPELLQCIIIEKQYNQIKALMKQRKWHTTGSQILRNLEVKPWLAKLQPCVRHQQTN